MRNFWNWVRNEDGTRILTIDGVIAEESWFDDDVTPKLFREQLNAGHGDIMIYINSPGGDCVAASQIYTMLMEYKGQVTVKIDGIAASAASVIAMAGTEVFMAPTSLMFVHNPLTVAIGDSEEMQKAIAMLDEVKESIISAYELKTGMSRLKISIGRPALTIRSVSTMSSAPRLLAKAAGAQLPAMSASRACAVAVLAATLAVSSGVILSRLGVIGKSQERRRKSGCGWLVEAW